MVRLNKYYFSSLLILVLFLVSVHWFYLDRIWTPVLSCICIVFLYLSTERRYNYRIFSASLTGILVFYVYKLLRFPGIGVLIEPLILIAVFFLSEEKKKETLRFLTVSFSIITLFSIVAWILYLFGIINISNEFEYNGYQFGSNALFLVNLDIGMGIIPRFQGLLLEPGHLGMICSLLLYANNYKRKDIFNIILFIGIVLTMSLAAYILFIIGYVLYNMSDSGKGSKITILVFLTIIVYVIFTLFQHTDSMLYYILFDKVADSENGILNGNRYGADFLQYYNNQLSNPFVAMFGLGDAFDSERFPGNSGYKVGIISMGWVGILILLFAYYCIAKPYHSKRCYFFLLLYIISYIQRPYADWLAEWFIFILAMPGLSRHSEMISYKKNEKIMLSYR